MSKNEKYLFWICVVVAMGLSIGAIIIALPRTVDMVNPTRLDYQGSIVAVFALLVTLLIGWQIYSALGIERRVYKSERRMGNTIDRLNAAEKRLREEAEAGEHYSSGVNYMCLAVTDYYHVRLDDGRSAQSKARGFAIAYTLAVRGVTSFLASGKDAEVVEPLIKTCVGLMNRCLDELSQPKYKEVAAFVPDRTKRRCKYANRVLMKNADRISSELFDEIQQCRTKRMALFDGKYEPAEDA